MRAVLVLVLVLLLGGSAVALTHSSARSSRTAARTLLASRRGCSSVSACVRGCSLDVTLKGPGDSPTTPCSSQAVKACVEDVASAPPLPAGPATGACSTTTAPELRSFRQRDKELRSRAERSLRSLAPSRKGKPRR